MFWWPVLIKCASWAISPTNQAFFSQKVLIFCEKIVWFVGEMAHKAHFNKKTSHLFWTCFNKICFVGHPPYKSGVFCTKSAHFLRKNRMICRGKRILIKKQFSCFGPVLIKCALWAISPTNQAFFSQKVLIFCEKSYGL